MRELKYVVPPDCHGMTVKDFARNRLGFSARMLTRQKQQERGILKNGDFCRTVDILSAGDILVFSLPEEGRSYQPEPAPLSVLWETEDYLAVEKPPGMPVHPSPGHDRDSLLNAVAYYYETTGQIHLFRPLYRLDRDTSGIVLLGKHRSAVSSAVVEKRYYGVCEEVLSGEGTIDIPIGLQPGSKIVRACGTGKSAVTHWKALKSRGGHTLLSFQLDTGRTHQIRAHMAYLHHPLAGDDLYGGSRKIIARQALHCGWVSLKNPALAVNVQIFSEIPSDIRAAFPWLPELRGEKREEPVCPLV